jgi:ribosomal protein L15
VVKTISQFVMTTLFEDNVYMVVENLHQSDAAIELTGGEWDGLVYQYGKVGFENGKPNINFERTIRRLPHNVEKTEEELKKHLNNVELKTLMGDILVEVMQAQIRKDNEQRSTKGTD